MNSTTIVLVVIYFFVLFALSRLQTPPVPGRILYLFRAFFPSWKFFDDYGDVPILFYRMSGSEKKFGDWVPCLARPKRRLRSFLVNPEGGFYLACTSLLEQVISELEEFEDGGVENFERTVSYQLIHNLVRFQIGQRPASGQSSFYQFKICSCLEELSKPIREDVLISSIYLSKR